MVHSWSGVAVDYDRSFARLCAGAVDPLLDALGPAAAGGRLLDAGTGTGVVAAAAIGRGWTVTAVDDAADMIEFTAARLPAATTATASMGELPYGDRSFQAIAANFSINHVDHADLVAAELHRVAAPGARIAATVWPWQPTEMNRLWSSIMDATGTRPAEVRLPAGERFPRTEDGLTALLAGGGFLAASARRLDWVFEIAPDELWAGVAAGIAVIGQAYLEADEPARARILAEYEARTAVLAPDGLLRFPVEAVLAVARA